MNGIDVSKHNGNIDWAKTGVDFAIIRAGYGRVISQKDPKFEANYAGAKAAGIPVGAYWYSYAKLVEEAKLEAEICLKVIKGKKFEYPIYFDIEDKSQENLGKEVLTDMCIAFCETLEKAGYYVGIYANVDWFVGRLDQNRLKDYDKWLAHWVKNPKWGSEFCGLWQYSATGKIAGINGDVDLNKSYRNYPAIIKKAGLNGYGAKSVDVTAKKANLSESEAAELKKKCEALGMSVVIT